MLCAMFSVLHEQKVCTSVCSTSLNEYENDIVFYCYYRLVLMTGQGNLGHQIASSLVKLILPTQLR
jgi:hypothetical protein